MTLKLDQDGLTTETETAIYDGLLEKLRAKFGANLKGGIRSINGQFVAITAELHALAQQALLSAYRSFDPDGAEGRALDARVGLTGTIRKGATNSSVTGTLTFSSAGTMNNGDLIRNDDNDTLWQLVDGPHTSAGPWPEEIAATFAAVETGPILANAGTTWSNVTVVAGLDGFTNPTDDAEPGRDREKDGELKSRRRRELYARGQGPLKAIEGAVSQVEGVVYARCYHNPDTQPADADGIPFKAFNVVVETNPTTPTSAQQQAIWDAIWSAMGAGGQAYGTDYVGSVTDSEGISQPVAFDVVTEQQIDLEIFLVTSTSEEAITPNLNTIVAERILEIAQAEHEVAGRDVRALDYQGIVYDMIEAGEISGVDGVNVWMSIKPAATANVAKLSIGIREKADFNSADVAVSQV